MSITLEQFIAKQIYVSSRAFGPNERSEGIRKHIESELLEIMGAESADERVQEWVDVIILGIDGAWRAAAHSAGEQGDMEEALSGISEQVASALEAKVEKNGRRKWPDWRTVGEDQPIEHVRGYED